VILGMTVAILGTAAAIALSRRHRVEGVVA